MHKETTGIYSMEDLQTVKANATTTAKALREEKDNLQQRARDHALATALEYYECSSEHLRKIVFANWLDDHAFEENFRPLKWFVR